MLLPFLGLETLEKKLALC
jgi:hypothetical protein